MEVEEFLEHHGVKGMKWGSRRGSIVSLGLIGHPGTGVKGHHPNHTLEELAHVAETVRSSSKVHNAFRKDCSDLHTKMGGGTLTAAQHKAYRKQIWSMYEKRVNAELPRGLTSRVLVESNNFSRDSREIILIGNKKGVNAETKTFKDKGFEHSDEEPISVAFELNTKMDASGYITETSFGSELQHSDAVEEFFMHHGVKGMKWGVHRFGRSAGGSKSSSRSKSSGPVKMGLKPAWHSPPMKKVLAAPAPSRGLFGRTKHPKLLSEEAKQLHEIRVKVKQHGIHSLTNKELETVNKRLDLQQKYQKAHPKKKNPFVSLAIDAALSDHGTKKISEFMLKKNVNKNMAGAVEAALAINKMARQGKK